MSTARNALLTTQIPVGEIQPHIQPQIEPGVVETLRNQIRKLETAGRMSDAKVISTGCSGMDRLLADGGLATGTITEWLTSDGGCGAELLSLLAAKEACADGGALVVFDPEHHFYPPAAAAWGIDLENVIILRSGSGSQISRSKPGNQNRRDASSLLWAIDQSLRCPAVAAVWGRLGHVSERWLRRFQLSAEQSGSVGLFVRPASVKGQPGWSEVQWSVFRERRRPSAVVSASASASVSAFDRIICLRLLRCHSGHAGNGSHVTLQIDFTTGKVQTVTGRDKQLENEQLENGQLKKHQSEPFSQKHSVRLAAQLAHPKTGGRRQRA